MWPKGKYIPSLLMMSLFMGQGYINHNTRRMGYQEKNDLDGVDIEEEYELIQQKKSQLSCANRFRVVSIYEERMRRKQNEKENQEMG